MQPALKTAPDAAPAIHLAETLTTRLCHDMAGLLATLSGTLEMLLEDHGADGEAAALATDAARTLAMRLRLYRAAWGGGDLEEASLTALAEGLPNRARLTLDLARLDEARARAALDEDGARLVLCLLLAATSGMPMGGDITGRVADSGVSITIAGRNAAWPSGLTTGASAAPPALAAPMAHMRAADMGWQLTVRGGDIIAQPG